MFGCSHVRNEDGRRIGARLLHSICHGREDWQTEMLLAGLLWVRASDHLCAILDSLLCVESALLARETLEEDLRLRRYPEIRC